MGSVDGGLFNSQEAVPVVTVNQWSSDEHWKTYGALFVHVATHSSFNNHTLTLHGRLDCASYTFSTDRDPFPPPHLVTIYRPTRRGPDGSISTSALSAGLELTLSVPQQSYPRNALVLVHVSIRNTSNHTIGYWVPGVGPAGFASPQAEVLDNSSKVVFPPAMPYMPALPGPAPGLEPLNPGQTRSANEYIVVAGNRIRASQQFAPNVSDHIYRPPNTLTTHPIAIRLTGEVAPKIVPHGGPDNPSLSIIRPPGINGPMLRLSYAMCDPTSGQMAFDYTFGWIRSGLTVTPTCSRVQAWYVRVAWLNHPVGAFNYIRPTPTPAPTPTPLPLPTPAPTHTLIVPARPTFVQLLHHAETSMASVHTLHAEGIRTAVSSPDRTELQMHADCASQPAHGLPVTLQTRITGRQSHVGAIGQGYILQGPVLPVAHSDVRAWQRSPATHQAWQAVDLHRAWGLSSDPIFAPTPAYVNQVCPDVLRLTYLSSPLSMPGARRAILGTETLAGRRVWHLREQLWWKADFYVDVESYRLRRLLLWDGAANSPNRWRVQFDYSGFNQRVRVTIPGQTRHTSRAS